MNEQDKQRAREVAREITKSVYLALSQSTHEPLVRAITHALIDFAQEKDGEIKRLTEICLRLEDHEVGERVEHEKVHTQFEKNRADLLDKENYKLKTVLVIERNRIIILKDQLAEAQSVLCGVRTAAKDFHEIVRLTGHATNDGITAVSLASEHLAQVLSAVPE